MADRSTELVEYLTEMRRKQLRPGTIDKRMSVLVRCEHAIGHPLVDAVTDELRGWLDGHTLQARTLYSYISHLASFWEWALTEERVTRDPTKRLTRPIIRQGLPRPVSTIDLMVLISNAPNAQMAAMVTLAAYAGLRCMEIAGLDAGDVMEHLNPPSIVIAHGKGDKARVIPVGQPVIDALHLFGIPPYGPVFRGRDGLAMKPWQVSHLLRDHMHSCRVTASAHQLRHTYGTEMYRRSGDLRMVQDMMGHSSPATTAGYAAWANDRAAGVVATLFT